MENQDQVTAFFKSLPSDDIPDPLPQDVVMRLSRKIRKKWVGSDRYNRQVAEVFTMLKGGEKSLNEEQLSTGYAYLYRAYSGKCPNNIAFENAEALAQQKRLGVWANAGLEKPWDYRKRLREKSD
ncbi:thermonuclease family protein [Iningainema tapete]|uniref:Thermonuclease family protein n=1 Tax=Iningainema tapete BLCC-T55 TaxID=2748662 RepID=A0A8J6XP18_9CYAN|nr:thermonuclease family protein [Iningainema tapete]MBD2778658.1 thermonuclease family protein [Iningainema tapete BLCC-T55]